MLDSYPDVFGTETFSGQETASVTRYTDRDLSRTISDAEQEDGRIDIEVRIGSKVIFAPSVPKVFKQRIVAIADRLESLAHLNDNWDSYKSTPIHEEALVDAFSAALSVLAQLRLDPMIGPLSAGGVGLEWQVGDKSVELDVWDSKTSDLLLIDAAREVEKEDISLVKARSLLLDWLQQ
jgi:hypothetical protein